MMSRVLYAILGFVLDMMARLPLCVLYGLSDVLYVVVYYIIGYRRRVVKANLEASFPDKSDGERRRIARQFYRNFTDYIVETIKLGHISDEEMTRRMEFVGIQVIDSFFDQGRSIAIYFSHCFNWEWAPSISLWTEHKPSEQFVFGQVYRQLKNPWFDAYFLRLRSRFGAVSMDKRVVFRDLVKIVRSGAQFVTGFMSDQKPSHGDTSHVVRFLNQPTAVITGTETLARKLKLSVVYWDMEKVKRGHYRITTRIIADDASATPVGTITDTYVSMLQASIERQPSLWLWSHKRWKNKVDYPSNTSDNEKARSSNNT